MTGLVVATDADFAWMLGEGPAPSALMLPPGGADKASVYAWLRENLRAIGPASSWLIAADGEVVGLCSFKAAPDPDGVAEIGYGVAPARRRRGHATRAIALMVEEAARQDHIRALIAATALTNAPSQRVLEANGFVQTGHGSDPDEGEMIIWRRAI